MRLSRITEDLLKLASLNLSGCNSIPNPSTQWSGVSMNFVACEPQWRSKSINMDVSLEEVVITADEDLLSQVWINLLHNSIKFTASLVRST